MIVVDVGHIPGVVAGEEAVLLGRGALPEETPSQTESKAPRKTEEISADDLAELTGTINYEVVTRIHADLPRTLVD